MDENRPTYDLQAPGVSGGSVRLPGRDDCPRVDDHLVEPEETREEIIGGVRYELSPADAPHGMQNSELDYVVRAHVADGYRVANDLSTRFDVDSDFASDTAVLKDGIDPDTGTRYLEELAFEVVSEGDEAKVRKKVPRMLRRGVRRVFAVFMFMQERRLYEWAVGEGDWRPLDGDDVLEDPSLARPIRVAALLDAAAADDAVAAALVAKRNPVLAEREQARGTRAKAEAVLAVLDARGLDLDELGRRRVVATTDTAELDRWLRRAAVADSIDAVFGND